MTERDDTPSGPGPADEPAPDETPSRGATDGEGADPGGSDPAGPPREIGGQQGPEPTRYGDWEGRGRCTDF